MNTIPLLWSEVPTSDKAEAMLRDAVRMQDEAVQRLMLLDRSRKDFIAIAAHELRTPLSCILGYTELLASAAEGSLNPDQLDLLERLDRNGRRLFALVEDLIELGGPDSTGVTLTRAPVDGNSAAQDAWQSVQPYANERGLQAQLNLCETAPQLLGDPAQVQRALVNLLDNAVKFTPRGGTVSLTVRQARDGVEFEVADTGMGIPVAERAAVFEPFFRTEQAQALAVPGAGIGLAIVQRIVDAHQGEVHVGSRSSGTAVLLTLPGTTTDTPAHPDRDDPSAPPPRPAPARSLEADLRVALAASPSPLVMHYQPVIDLTSGKVVAVEALVRWRHPVRGLLGPDRFLAMAEATGLIHQLGDWALDRAVRDASTLRHQGRELDMAVNFSGRQLDGDVVAKVQRALDESGLRPARLILEVTESAFAQQRESTATAYAELSRIGVKLAVDDFGTGYSSLLHLRRHPIDALKIDREFVAGIGDNPDDEAICKSIISLASAVGASTVGEGIETATQYAVLRSLGCLRGQGFLWSPAVPIAELGAAFAACDDVPIAARRSRMSPTSHRLPTEVEGTITTMHAEGASMHTIAAALNRTVGRHPGAMRWTASAVDRALTAKTGNGPRRQHLDEGAGETVGSPA